MVDVPAWWSVRTNHLQEFPKVVSSYEDISLGEDELEFLQYAYRFAKAAYGEWMEKGYMSDASSYVLMEAKTTGGVVRQEDENANKTALLNMARLTEKDLVSVCMHGETMRPSHACLLDHERRRAVLCIRGTLTMEDALTNTATDAAKYSSVHSGTVHEGMLQAATFVIDSCKDAMVRAAQSNPGYELIVTGHSLGAGAAAVITVLLSEGLEGVPRAFGFQSLRGVGFATPGVVSVGLCQDEQMLKTFTTVVYNRDLIARLCIPKMDSLLYEVAKESTLEKGKQLARWVMNMEQKHTKTGCASEAPHFPLGRCILFADPAGSGDLVTKNLLPEQLNKIFVHEMMMMDHILQNYGAALGVESRFGSILPSSTLVADDAAPVCLLTSTSLHSEAAMKPQVTEVTEAAVKPARWCCSCSTSAP